MLMLTQVLLLLWTVLNAKKKKKKQIIIVNCDAYEKQGGIRYTKTIVSTRKCGSEPQLFYLTYTAYNFYSSCLLKNHKISHLYLYVKYLSSLLIIHGKWMLEIPCWVPYMYHIWYFVMIPSSAWLTISATIPLLKDPCFSFPTSELKLWPNISLFFSMATLFTCTAAGILVFPTWKVYSIILAMVKDWYKQYFTFLVMLVNNCLSFFIFSISVFQVFPFFRYIFTWTFLFITKKNCLTSI